MKDRLQKEILNTFAELGLELSWKEIERARSPEEPGDSEFVFPDDTWIVAYVGVYHNGTCGIDYPHVMVNGTGVVWGLRYFRGHDLKGPFRPQNKEEDKAWGLYSRLVDLLNAYEVVDSL